MPMFGIYAVHGDVPPETSWLFICKWPLSRGLDLYRNPSFRSAYFELLVSTTSKNDDKLPIRVYRTWSVVCNKLRISYMCVWIAVWAWFSIGQWWAKWFCFLPLKESNNYRKKKNQQNHKNWPHLFLSEITVSWVLCCVHIEILIYSSSHSR